MPGHPVSRLALAAGVIVLSVGCGKKAEPAVVPPPPAAVVAFKVTSVDLGKGIMADKMVTNSTDNFSTPDILYQTISDALSEWFSNLSDTLGCD